MEQINSITIDYAANWLCRMAAADGVVSARERKLLTDFAGHYGLDAKVLIRRAYAMSKEATDSEVEAIDRRAFAGRKFEEFVVSLCADKNRFKLLAWRGDKISGTIYAEDTLMPDLHLRHRLDAKEVEYYVECKYRTTLCDGKLDLTRQLKRYRRMSSAKDNTDLFIAVGIGGTPSAPEKFYIIPSRMIKHDHVLNIENFSKCLCQTSGTDFHNYINHFYNKRVFRIPDQHERD